ncbi:hypothetical protein [Streptomyces sp. A0958]|uniref:hypothetical protein n=1 Tax=Streptomyces sp. A0958 TaxID=2563101 RepID=UPI001447A84D|nr:hypothetical protein [Streptomyces sp. A0958]
MVLLAIRLTVRLQRLLAQFTFGDDGTVWSVVGDGIAAGQRFKGDSPGTRSLHG